MSVETTVLDVAKYILHKTGRITCMKLQKLVYYSQAWALVWDGRPLFRDRIEAWANGPVAPRLYDAHRGTFEVTHRGISGNTRKLESYQKETIDAVLGYYGDKSPQWLSALTHRELPWLKARSGLATGERGFNQITHKSMAEYYESLL